MSIPEGWEKMAEHWDAHEGDEGSNWHRALLHPALLRVVGPLGGQRVLDVGCGNGSLARQLARRGAHVTGVDASAPVIVRAQQREAREPLGIVYHVADAQRMEPIRDGWFDLAVSCMALQDIRDAAGAIREVARALKPRGRFVPLFSHPCFDIPEASAWVAEHSPSMTTRWRKVSRYRGVFDAPLSWKCPSGGAVVTRSYHRPLSWYFRALHRAGFVVMGFEEPAPTEEFAQGEAGDTWPDAPFLEQIPLHCIIDAWKMSWSEVAGGLNQGDEAHSI
jgi:ubiquinone/menaquinone biosynthesis C-methylase UbiE